MRQDRISQTWRAKRYAETARFVSDLGAPVLELLALKRGERILDIGCGDGVLTEKIVAAGAEVVGVDSAPDMIAAARKRGLDARVMRAEELRFEHEFDAVFSNAAMHWMREPDVVIAGVRRALKPGGRFVAEMGGHGCVAAVTVALVAVLARHGIDGASAIPWYFPTVEDYQEKLMAAGFIVDYIELIPRPTPLPTDIGSWLDTFAQNFFAQLKPRERRAARRDVIELLKPALCDSRGCWTADYTRLRFAAHLPRGLSTGARRSPGARARRSAS
jgi:trans-aconitate methyltransferase